MKHIGKYLQGAIEAIERVDRKEVMAVTNHLRKLKKRKGRLFLIGVGGSAANCSHAVNDFRKICGIEAYTPVDNVSELTARSNDDGWETVFVNWLIRSQLSKKDTVFVLSVGGGSVEKNVSVNIVKALQFAHTIGATILGIVSRDGGYTKKVADACILIPIISDDTITPYAESMQALLWHGIVFHPLLK